MFPSHDQGGDGFIQYWTHQTSWWAQYSRHLYCIGIVLDQDPDINTVEEAADYCNNFANGEYFLYRMPDPITGFNNPTISNVAPNFTNQVLYHGTAYEITWQTDGMTDDNTVRIELQRVLSFGYGTTYFIRSVTQDDGSYIWDLSDFTLTGNFRIKVFSDGFGYYEEAYSETFTIADYNVDAGCTDSS